MRTRAGVSVALVAISVVVVVGLLAAVLLFVWSPFVPSHSHSTSTTSTVNTPANLLAVTGQLPSAYCSAPSGTYSNSSLTINWGNLAPGTQGIDFVCLKNTGTTGITLSVSSNLSPTIGRVTSPQAGTLLNGQGIEMIELDLHLSPNVQLGPIGSFMVTIGGTS